MKLSIYLIAFISALFFLSSCEGAYDFNTDNLSTHIELNSDIAIPIIDASISLEEILPKGDETESFLIIDNEGFISLNYKFELTAVSIEDLLKDEPLSGSSLPYVTYQISPQIIYLGLEKLLKQGEIVFANPSATVYIKNYWSVPVQFKFQDFYYYDDETSYNKHLFTGSVIDSWIIVNYPLINGNFETTEIALDNTTSNIDEVISNLPHHLSFGATFETIPGDAYDVPPHTMDSIKMDLSIPLDLRMQNIVMQDTIEFSLGDSDTTLIESLILGIEMNNGFPISINTQFYFVDDEYVVLDSLFTNGLKIDAGLVDINGKVNQNTETTTISETNDTRIKNILKSTNIIFKIILNTTDANLGQNVKLYSNYEVGIKMGARFKLNPSL
ncbi:MAG: hypothetical protein JXR51_06455 [Bacteroidales bacterium]|nr:hypothetical protein [Bacteroidales bacterium]MBN2756803.1 hypothetical protein [Bacteroidales bacterium]